MLAEVTAHVIYASAQLGKAALDRRVTFAVQFSLLEDTEPD
jgi:hypothetical protein